MQELTLKEALERLQEMSRTEAALEAKSRAYMLVSEQHAARQRHHLNRVALALAIQRLEADQVETPRQDCGVRQEQDEYYCSTHNVRWGVDEGDTCPKQGGHLNE